MESINFDFGLIGNGYPFVALNATNGYSIPPSNSEELVNALAGKDKNGKKAIRVRQPRVNVQYNGTIKYKGKVYSSIDEFKKAFPNARVITLAEQIEKRAKKVPEPVTKKPAVTTNPSADTPKPHVQPSVPANSPINPNRLPAVIERKPTEMAIYDGIKKKPYEEPKILSVTTTINPEEQAEPKVESKIKPAPEGGQIIKPEELKANANKGKFWSKFGKAFKSKTGKGALAALAVAAAGLLLAKACDGDEKVPAAEVPQKPAPKPAAPVQPAEPAQEQPVQEQPAQRVEHKVQDGETYWGHAELDKITQNLEAIKVPDSEITEQTTELMHENEADWDQNDIKNKSKFIHSDPLLRTGDTIKIADYKARIIEEARRQLKAEGKENPTDEEIKEKFNEIKAKLLAEIKPDRKSTKLALEQVKYDE